MPSTLIASTETTIISQHDQLPLALSLRVPAHPVATLQLVHGMAEHRERYHAFMDFCAQQGIVTIIHDHRGHGASVKSPDDYGYFSHDGLTAMVSDVHQVTKYVKSYFPGLPLTLLGHSMGSLVVRCYLKQYDSDINQLIVCGSPSKRFGSGLAQRLSKWLQLFQGDRHRSRLINHLAFGGYNKKFPDATSPNSWIVSDPAVVAAYDADPRDGFTFTLNGFETLFTLINQAYSKSGWQLHHPELPILFIAGADDPCIISPKDFQKAVNFLRLRGYHDVSSKLYPNMRHEILNEIHKQQVWQDVVSFVKTSRLAAG